MKKLKSIRVLALALAVAIASFAFNAAASSAGEVDADRALYGPTVSTWSVKNDNKAHVTTLDDGGVRIVFDADTNQNSVATAKKYKWDGLHIRLEGVTTYKGCPNLYLSSVNQHEELDFVAGTAGYGLYISLATNDELDFHDIMAFGNAWIDQPRLWYDDNPDARNEALLDTQTLDITFKANKWGDMLIYLNGEPAYVQSVFGADNLQASSVGIEDEVYIGFINSWPGLGSYAQDFNVTVLHDGEVECQDGEPAPDVDGIAAIVAEAEAAIDALPAVDSITLANEAAVVAARAKLGSTSAVLNAVDPTKLAKLEAAEEKIAELKAAAEVAGQAQAEALVEAIGNIDADNVTLHDKEEIEAAEAIYASLSSANQRLVTNYMELLVARQELDFLLDDDDNDNDNVTATPLLQYGLSVDENGSYQLNGSAFYGYGINAAQGNFWTHPDDTHFADTLATCVRYDIPYIRTWVIGGSWTGVIEQFEAFKNGDDSMFDGCERMLDMAQEAGVGVIACIFTSQAYTYGLGERPSSQGEMDSKSMQYMREWLAAFVERFKDHPALWGWELRNEGDLAADLGPLGIGGDVVQFGDLNYTRPQDGLDSLPSDGFSIFYREAAAVIRELDGSDRMISNGNAMHRNSAYHMHQQSLLRDENYVYPEDWILDFTVDTLEQWKYMHELWAPGEVDTISTHMGMPNFNNFIYGLSDVTMSYEELLQEYVSLAKSLKKGFFYGEFGDQGHLNVDDPRDILKNIKTNLELMVRNDVQLGALWQRLGVNDYIKPEAELRLIMNEIKKVNQEFKKQGLQKTDEYWAAVAEQETIVPEAEAAIDALPAVDSITLANEAAVVAIREMLGSTGVILDAIDPAKLAKLEAAEAKIEELKALNLVTTIDEIVANGITLDSEEAIKAAEAIYASLSTENKELVTNYADLLEARQQLDALLAAANTSSDGTTSGGTTSGGTVSGGTTSGEGNTQTGVAAYPMIAVAMLLVAGAAVVAIKKKREM